MDPKSPRIVALVIGPYAAPTDRQIRRNVARALGVGRLAAKRGYAPIVLHAMGWLGCHGDPFESDQDTRPVALECGSAIAEILGRTHAEVWGILRDDGTLSSGTEMENSTFALAAHHSDRRLPTTPVLRTWAEWEAEGAVELWPADPMQITELEIELASSEDQRAILLGPAR